MRLTQPEIETIRTMTLPVVGQCAAARLFGSRLDDQARGGDIDC